MVMLAPGRDTHAFFWVFTNSSVHVKLVHFYPLILTLFDGRHTFFL
jgi:hypothetical protein